MPTAGGTTNRDACKADACAIQDCLASSDYDMSKCKKQVCCSDP